MSKSTILYLGHTDHPDMTISFAINGKRYNYLFHNYPQFDCALYLTREISAGKALAYTKKRAALLAPMSRLGEGHTHAT